MLVRIVCYCVFAYVRDVNAYLYKQNFIFHICYTHAQTRADTPARMRRNAETDTDADARSDTDAYRHERRRPHAHDSIYCI